MLFQLYILTAHNSPTLKSFLMSNTFSYISDLCGRLQSKALQGFFKSCITCTMPDLKILKYSWSAVAGAQKLDGTEWKTDKLSKMALSSTYPVLHMHFWKLSQRCWWATSEISWPLSRICTAHEMWKALCPEIFWDSCKEKTALL